MKTNRILILSALAFLSIFAMEGCRKKGETIAIIHVRDLANQAVSGAQVILYPQPTNPSSSVAVLYDTAFTNSAGEALFNYDDVYQLGQAGVAVLDIKVKKDGMSGSGIIKIEEETTSEETVYIQ